MPDLFLPPGVRYTCLRCGLCCRSLEVTLTEAERERLLATGGTPVAARLFARLRGARGKQAWRLRPRPDGSCPFLGDDGLCQVHATLGYAAKPFAGRVFPFQFVVTPVGVFVGCRFDCPAVVRGSGEELEKQRGEVRRLYGEYARTYEPPTEDEPVRFFGHYKLSWRDLLRLEDQLTAFVLMSELNVPRRLLACLRLVRQFVGLAVGRRQESRVGTDPEVLLDSVRGDVKGKRPGVLERLLVRLVVAAFVGATPHSYRELPLASRLRVRFGNLWRRLKMALGVGRVRLPGIERPVRLREVGSVDMAALDAASAAMLQRYLVAKVASQQFFGRACFGRSFAQGFEFLALAYAAIVWLAAAHALASGRRQTETADVEYGIRQVDHGYNYLRELGGLAARTRAMLLWHWGTTEKVLTGLCRQR
ncbi:MAG TPA: YkgJ family cysteine cluster protein [Planctomycetota bacterium]|nr:YkgJ family cysteine cluster protein [Planctomycetota bacterium]